MSLPRLLQVLTLLLLALALACSPGGGKGGKDGRDGKDGKDGKDGALQADPRALVEALAVARGSIADAIVSSGTVESEAQADLYPETTGIVTAVRVEEGDTVARGQVLAVIENPNLDGTLARAREQHEQARRAWEETVRLAEAGAASPRQVLDAKSALDLASAASDEARATQAFTRLTSPIRGTVSFRDLRFGENAVPGRRAFQVVDLDRLRVVVSLPEKDLTRVHEGQTAVMRPSYAPELAVPARVVRIGPVIDPASGTFRVTLQPEGPSLRPGQFVTVSIEQERRENVLVLPRRVLVWDEGEPFVFRVEEAPPETPEEARKREEKEEKQGKKEKNKGFFFSFGKGGEKEGGSKPPEIPGPRRVAHKVPVRLGFLEADRVEVLEEASPATDALRRPLAEGELVVKVGQETLREGSRIRLPEDPVWKPEEDEKTPDEGASDAK